MAKTLRIRNKVVKLLSERGECNTRQIYDHINDTSCWGVTMNQLGNILARDNRINKQRQERIFGRTTDTGYNVCVWTLKPSARDQNDQN